MNLKKLTWYFLTIILAIIIYLIIKNIYYFDWMKKAIILVISLFSSITITCSFIAILKEGQKTDYLLLFSYLIVLVIILFHRPFKTEKRIILDINYLEKWLEIIFKNPIVFLNIFGNIILFVPMGILINNLTRPILIKMIYLLSIIILIEVIQFIFNLGIFDILDIILNFIGGITGILLTYQKKELK